MVDGSWSRTRPRDGLLAAALGVVIGLLCWRLTSIAPTNGIDGSWHAALYLAFERGFNVGSDIAFTYGPLGFLAAPQLYEPRLGALAWVLNGAVQLALCAVIAVESQAMGRTWPRTVLIAAAGGVATIVLPTLIAMTCLAVWVSVRALGPTPRSPRLDVAIAAALGVAGGVIVLVKLNDGLTVLALGGAVAAGLARPIRTIPAYAAGATAALVAVWTGTGQRLEDVVPFVRVSLDIISGYASAMARPTPSGGWLWVALLATTIVFVDSIRRTTRDWRPVARAALAVGLLAVWFVGYRHGFVRHTPGAFFVTLFLLCGWLLTWRPDDRERRLLAGAVLGMIVLASTQLDAARLRPLQRLAAAADQLATILDTDRRVALINDARADFRAEYSLPAGMLERIGGSTVHIASYETAVAWAYPGLHWSPVPVFQHYQAYTEGLDSLNADRLASEDGPRFVLRRAPAPIDARSDWYETPTSSLALVCHFDVALANAQWLLLERTADRCSHPTPLGTWSLRPGESVAVPIPARPGRLIVMHIRGLGADPGLRLATLFLEPPIWSIELSGVWTYRLVPGTASGPLVVGHSTSLGYGAAFRPPKSPASIRIIVGDAVGRGFADPPEIEIEVEFEAIDVAATEGR